MPHKDKPVWFVTGCSSGFGREIARYALNRGYHAVVTARIPAQVEDIQPADGERALVLPLDVTAPEQITDAVKLAEETFGRIDVLVNNAGVGYFGAIEESGNDDVRRMFEINFWGLANLTRAVLPGMRKRRAGRLK